MCNYKGMKLTRRQLMEVLEMERDLKENDIREQEYVIPVHNGFDYNKVDILTL